MCTIHTTDTQSGLQAVGLDLEDDELQYPGRGVSGTRRDGLWRVVIPFKHCFSRAGLVGHDVVGFDRAATASTSPA
jgi:hypothetical protein